VVAAATLAIEGHFLEAGCGRLAIALIRLKVTFSAARFFRIFHDAGSCARNVEMSFVTTDVAFPVGYGLFLCALYLWTERWQRFATNGEKRNAIGSRRRDLIVVAPLIAAVLDIVVENLSLWYAGRFQATPGASTLVVVRVAVLVGSLGALFKWLLLLLSGGGILAELLAGPRGAILWRLRFSSLAVALGAVPLLAIPQGQDILQRIFETDHPLWRLFVAVPPVAFAALSVWYVGRKLTELQLDDPPPPKDWGWYEFFGEHLPRLLGVAALVIPGIAFARAGNAAPRYVMMSAVACFAAYTARLRFPRVLGSVGRPLMLQAWTRVPGLDERLGQCVLVSLIGALAAVPPFAPALLWPTLCLRLAAYLCFVVSWFFQLFVTHRREVRAARTAAADSTISSRPALDSIGLREIGRGLRVGAATAATFSVLLLILFTAVPVTFGRWLGPLWILSLTVANAVFVGSVLVWVGKRFKVPVVTVSIALALLFSVWNDSHSVRTLGEPIAQAIADRPSVDYQFSRWLSSYHGDRLPANVPVVLVAGAGGGLRAAYWTAISLAAIADLIPSFEKHIFAFSGVSGGSLGGALFVAFVRDKQLLGGQLACSSLPNEPVDQPKVSGPYATCVRNLMREDYLSPLLAKLLAPDFLQLFLPFPVPVFDRSKALEGSWEESYFQKTGTATFSSGFLAFAQTPRAVAPVLIFNSTHVESGRRYMASSVYRSREAGKQYPMQDAGDVLEVLQRDIPMATAVHNSARFTFASPAGHLEASDSVEHGHIVDGGYFENSGLATLRDVYDIVRARGAMPYVLYLCNDPSSCGAEDSTFVGSSAADEVASPIRALLKTRDARGSLARANLRDLSGRRFLQMNVCGDLPPELTADPNQSDKTKDRVVTPPLGWLLSSLARDWMDKSLGDKGGDGNCYERNAAVIETIQNALANW
jgi:hypothetical protein